MGEALIRGFCKSGVSSVEQISASVRSFDRQRALSNLGLRVYGNALEGGAADLAANSEIIFLGVSYIDSHMRAATKMCTSLLWHMLPADSLSCTPQMRSLNYKLQNDSTCSHTEVGPAAGQASIPGHHP